MKILGIDPGTAIVGWGVIEKGTNINPIAYDSIMTSKKLKLPDRLLQIHTELSHIIKTYQPDVAAVEELFFVKNVTTGMSVSHARGVILLALNQAGVEIFEYKPMQIKQAVTGYGRADKRQVQQMVKATMGLKEIPKPDDTADALAVALCHEQNIKWQKIIGKHQ
ncbi:MAG: crossover junction endodeoxyribonuclease RuvC [bacterium]|nr:crossover junction endodeoxyribonuclease RuvC [bacterium]